jgi:hypothetical protein
MVLKVQKKVSTIFKEAHKFNITLSSSAKK